MYLFNYSIRIWIYDFYYSSYFWLFFPISKVGNEKSSIGWSFSSKLLIVSWLFLLLIIFSCSSFYFYFIYWYFTNDLKYLDWNLNWNYWLLLLSNILLLNSYFRLFLLVTTKVGSIFYRKSVWFYTLFSLGFFIFLVLPS